MTWRQILADLRTGLRDPYFWLCCALLAAGMAIVVKALIIGDRDYAMWALIPLGVAALTLEVERRTRRSR